MTKGLHTIFRDPVSGLTHLAGALLGVAGLGYLAAKGVRTGDGWQQLSFAIFGISLILLYSSSALYHLLHVSENRRLVLRRIDHTMIFVLIAGTYTPFCLLPLRGPWGWSLFAVVWTLALGGFAVSIFWIRAPRWLTTTLYLVMGWIVVIAVYPLSQTVSVPSLLWLATGGILYSVGALVYAFKWPDPFPPTFGFHEIWHLFVLAGSASHFISVALLT